MKQDFVTLWKNLATNKQNTRVHHVQYCILRAMAAKSEDKIEIARHFIRKAFAPVTKTTKLANGRTPFDILATWQTNASTHSINNVWNAEAKKWEQLLTYRNVLGVPANELLDEEELKLYGNILQEVCSPGRLVRRYSYFFTRQDIFEEYQLVQTAHAALELGSKLTEDQVKDLHFTCCGVDDLEALENAERVLESMGVPFIVFREPDIGNQKTAIGVYPLEEHKRGLLRNYRLLRFNAPKILPTPIEMQRKMEVHNA
jgi:hypothetical protein